MAAPPACLWGCKHEANNTMLLLRCHTKVQCLQGFSTVKVQDCGFYRLTTSPLSVVQWYLAGGLVPLGATPDCLLHCSSPGSQPRVLLGEFKSMFPCASTPEGTFAYM